MEVLYTILEGISYMSHKLNISVILLLLTCIAMFSQCSPISPPAAPAVKEGNTNAM